jgi:2',3'-cyclic-nucleotide 2'-phosphodiesterase (5'-nucleotidase family)
MSLRLLHYADIENAYDDPERIGRLAGLINRLRDEETVVCGAGDNTAPGVLSLVTQGRQALDFFRTVEPDAEVFGNHDFDYGIENARALAGESPQPWLCANIFEGDERFATEAGTLAHTIVEIGSYRVGLVGVTTPDTPVMTPETTALDFTDPISAATASTDQLRGEVDTLVVLSHCGDDTDLAVALDADAILGGHKHQELVEHIDGTLVARPGSNGRWLLEIDFSGETPTATRHSVADGPLDESVAAALRARMDETGLTETVTTLDELIAVDDRARMGGESRVGNFVTDALRWRADSEVAMMRAGIRENDPLSDSVTAADLIGVLPFDNDLCVLRLTGEQLLESFRELSVSYRHSEAPNWWFGHVSGATVVWDDRKNTLVEARVGGSPVGTDTTYTVAVDEHHVESNHLFSGFDANDVTHTAGKAYEALVEYARKHGIHPEIEGRIRRPAFETPEME